MHADGIDWGAIHRRLEASAAAISGRLDRGPEEVRRILEARARVAARPPVEPDGAEHLDLLAFSLAGEAYGVETRHVREVCQLRDLTSLPCTPAFVAGVMSLRGRILAVMDLRKLFELPARGLTELNRVIVLEGDGVDLGLLADGIEGLRKVATSDLQEGLPTLTGVRERLLLGVTGQMLAVLDGRRLLAGGALEVDEKVAR